MNIYSIIISLSVTLFFFNNCTPSFQGQDPNQLSRTPDSIHDFNGGSTGPLAQIIDAKIEPGGNNSYSQRHLTALEVQNSLESIFELSFPEVTNNRLIPSYTDNHFSNHSEKINFSKKSINRFESLSSLVVEKLQASENASIKKHVPCLTNSFADTCINSFIDKFSLLLFRKNISSELKGQYFDFLKNTATGDKWEKIQFLIEAMVMSPSFLFRFEYGKKDATGFALTNFEVASRMAFFLTGRSPDLELLNLAQNEELLTGENLKLQAQRLIRSDNGKKQIVAINLELFEIDKILAPEPYASDFFVESKLLIEKILLEDGKPWRHLFGSTGSFINRNLAGLYGMPKPAGEDFEWVEYGDIDRRGILNHGAFLSKGYIPEVEETSPITRGLEIVEKFLCLEMPLPDDVDVDEDPARDLSNMCNIEARKATTLNPNGSCYNCHIFMEPLGLAFERFNNLGEYRTAEKDRPECTTLESGNVNRVEFSSMTELADVFQSEERLEHCFSKRMAEYAFGKHLTNGQVASLWPDLTNFQDNRTVESLFVDLVTSPQFLRRDNEIKE